MLALLQNEYIKVFARRGFQITCLFFIILATIPIILNSVNVDEDVYIILNGLIQTLVYPSGFYILFSTSNLVLIDEFKTGTINLIATCPLKRWQILFGKYMTILSITVVYTMLVATILSFSNNLADEYLNFMLIIIFFFFPFNFLLAVLLNSSRTFAYVIAYYFLNIYFMVTGVHELSILKYSPGICIVSLMRQLGKYIPTTTEGDVLTAGYQDPITAVIGVIYLIILTLIPFIIFQKRDLASK